MDHRPRRINDHVASSTAALADVQEWFADACRSVSTPWRPEGAHVSATTHADPTGQRAAQHADLLDAVMARMAVIRQDILDARAMLAEFRPVAHAPRRGCDVQGCDRVHHAAGMCQTHYRRTRRGETRPDGRRREHGGGVSPSVGQAPVL